MEQVNYTTKNNKSKHLTLDERIEIEFYHRCGYSPYKISKLMGRASNTIRNELKRGISAGITDGKYQEIYRARAGQERYKSNRQYSKKTMKIWRCQKFIKFVEDKLIYEKYSIDSSVGSAKSKGLFEKGEMVCTKTIYNYIDRGLMRVKNINLPVKVSMQPRKKKVTISSKINGRSILERDPTIDSRDSFGAFEVDTVCGRKGSKEQCILVLTERKTRFQINKFLKSKRSDDVNAGMREIIKDLGKGVIKSITADNGSEFSNLSELENEYNLLVYYARPYTPQDRGTNENQNKLIRRFIPKGKSMNNYTNEDIKEIEAWMNNLPRKILGYNTSKENFLMELCGLNIKD
jgi:Transposase and inactivated derivatives, IS30 family